MNRIPAPVFILLLLLCSCHSAPPKESDVVKNPTKLRKSVIDNLKDRLEFIHSSKENTEHLFSSSAVYTFYKKNNFKPIWSDSSIWLLNTDSLISLLSAAPDNGIDTQFLHLTKILSIIHQTKTDTLAVKDAAMYAHAEVLMTDAYFSYANRICFSQYSPDSIRLKKQKQFSDSLLLHFLSAGIQSHHLTELFSDYECKLTPYIELKAALKNFRMDFLNAQWTKVPDTPSVTPEFKNLLRQRLSESCIYDSTLLKSDSLKLAAAMKTFQSKHGLFADGVPGKRTLKAMNVTVNERINQINLTLDQWRAEPDSLPDRYIYVNLPAFYLQYFVNDTVRVESKIICGALKHNSPVLNAALTYFLTYPYWTVPFSIATKEILPHLQRDTSYLRRNNMDVLNSSREVIDATNIKWKKYSKTYFPFILRQREGLDNSLGVVKFMFPNPYGIYLHETDARNLFKKDFRALSHGCVRVEQAVKLAYELAKQDSIKYPTDSIKHWLDFKIKKQVDLKQHVPLYIRYNLCEVKNGKLIFYEDIYDYQKPSTGFFPSLQPN
ncbi:MAG: L,D-transpeptidase family protein [Bacteroidota bacterium]